MGKRTRKVGIVGKYGTRYGASIRKQIKKPYLETKRKRISATEERTLMNRFPHSEMNNRRDLFSTSPNAKLMANQSDDFVENQNDQRINHLGNQISQLKDITLQIRSSVQESNIYLGEMEKDFNKTGGMLGRTMKNLDNLRKSPHGRQMMWLILFVLFVFFVIYFLIRG